MDSVNLQGGGEGGVPHLVVFEFAQRLGDAADDRTPKPLPHSHQIFDIFDMSPLSSTDLLCVRESPSTYSMFAPAVRCQGNTLILTSPVFRVAMRPSQRYPPHPVLWAPYEEIVSDTPSDSMRAWVGMPPVQKGPLSDTCVIPHESDEEWMPQCSIHTPYAIPS